MTTKLQYRDWAMQRFSPRNWRKVIQIAEQLVKAKEV